jgi:hypothetical protein
MGTEAQTQRVDLAYPWPLREQPLQVLLWFCPCLRQLIILGLERESLPTLPVLPRNLLQRGVCPGDDGQARGLVIPDRHALMPDSGLLLFQQRPQIATYLLIRALSVPGCIRLLQQQDVGEEGRKKL